MIIQWGLSPAPSANDRNVVTFSVAYTQVPSVVAINRGLNDSDFANAPMGYMQATTTGFQVDSNYGNGTKVRVTWIAIG